MRQEITKFTEDALKDFMLLHAEKQLDAMDERGSMPKFDQDEYGQLRKADFRQVVRALYCLEPGIFHKLNSVQEKSLLQLINLLLSSDRRENMLSVVEQVTTLTPEQRKGFADALLRSKLQYMAESIGVIEKRKGVVDRLRQMVFGMPEFTSERDHIQKIMEQHFWLFGEQYHLLASDKALANSLKKFEELTQSPACGKKAIVEASQQAGIFLYTQREMEDGIGETVVVELKAPSVALTNDVFAQVVRYANTVRKDPLFNGPNRQWRFYAVCATVDDDVKTKYENFRHHGKHGLADIVGNFEIYALSWDDIFQAFESQHNFLLDKLKQDMENAISDDIEKKASCDSADQASG